MAPTLPPEQLDAPVRAAALELRDGLRLALADGLHALYLYGSVTFGDSEGTGDLDYHAILTAQPDASQQAAVAALAMRLANHHPQYAGDEQDGWLISLDAARRSNPPAHLLLPGLRDTSWALHRAHWLAGRCVVLHGPAPDTIVAQPTAGELRAGLTAELEFAAREANGDSYVVLNTCRIICSVTTGNVVISKFGAARWGLAHLPSEHHAAITAAMNRYRRIATTSEMRALADGRGALLALATRALAS